MSLKKTLWTCSTSWEWAFQGAQKLADVDDASAWRSWSKVDKLSQLPSWSRDQGNALLRMETVEVTQDENQDTLNDKVTSCQKPIWFAAGCFDGLGDKDNLWIVLEKLGLERFVPQTSVLPWDVSTVEDIVLPESKDNLVVLKPPLGCHGEGIVFYKSDPSSALATKETILATLTVDADRARAERGFIEHLISLKGRLPGWVVQAHIKSMLLSGDRKFHLRAYICADDLQKTLFMYPTIEVRIAEMAYNQDDCNDRAAHITNGAGGDRIRRALAREVPELEPMQDTLCEFIQDLLSEPAFREAVFDPAHRPPQREQRFTGRFAVGALDLMIDEDGRPYILEVNARSPGCAPEGTGSPEFQAHMQALAYDLLRMGASAVRKEDFQPQPLGFYEVVSKIE